MVNAPTRGRRRLLAAAAAAVLCVLGASLLAPGPTGAGVVVAEDPPEEPYEAQGLWTAKHLVRADSAWLLVRPLWMESPAGRGVRVAVVDTGVDAAHPDLADAVVMWRDFAGDRDGTRHAAPYDDHGHGTHVAGIVAGRGHLQPNPVALYFPTGLRGIAPEVELLVAKAMRHDGRGDDSTVAEAILWAIDPDGDGDLSDGAHVINLSVGIEPPEPGSRSLDFLGTETRRAVNLAILRGVVVVVSSGNEGADRVVEPGDVPLVVTVGAVDAGGEPTDFTNVGDGLDLLAPGILASAYPRELDELDYARDGYAALAGTSMAAPVVSGVVALMMEADPALMAKGGERDHSEKVAHVERVLKATARHVPPDASGRAYGAGLLDARAAVAAVDAGGGAVSWPAVGSLALLAALVTYGVGVRPLRRRRLLAAEEPSREGDAGPVEFGVSR